MLARLQVRLLADDVVVAESDAPALWAAVLEAIQARGDRCLPCELPPVCVGQGTEPCRRPI